MPPHIRSGEVVGMNFPAVFAKASARMSREAFFVPGQERGGVDTLQTA